MVAWKRSDALNGAHGTRHDRLVDEEFLMAGSWRQKALCMWTTMSWQAPGVCPMIIVRRLALPPSLLRAIDRLAGSEGQAPIVSEMSSMQYYIPLQSLRGISLTSCNLSSSKPSQSRHIEQYFSSFCDLPSCWLALLLSRSARFPKRKISFRLSTQTNMTAPQLHADGSIDNERHRDLAKTLSLL